MSGRFLPDRPPPGRRPLLPRRLELELLGTEGSGAFVCARYRVAGPLLEDRAPR